MFIVTAKNLELRGIANQTSKNGTVYYIVNCELTDGTPYSFYCPKADAFAEGLKKGDKVNIDFTVKRYKQNENLVVERVYR